MRVISSWSGGKESCLAVYKAMQGGLAVSHLLNMAVDGRSHGLDRGLILAQSEAIGIPLVQRVVTWDTYEEEFKKAVGGLKIEGMVFGDIDVQDHRDWVEGTCSELGIKPFLPLWKRGREELMDEFISAGFKAVVVCVKSEFDRTWLGRIIDEEFIKDASDAGIDVCGENGEYHTLVVDGPLFRNRIEVVESRDIEREGKWFMDITEHKLR
ncbi:MAG: diphthine--ammonia ligase [Candidatus Altiarchaeales archaeon]|nr:diphthine--ammonia ligase [Candidatus Altiarchaeota archaeon]MCG2782384.1 diphthine--ammonia ligase [Candidatus Altiarchaeales archaeon]